MRIPVLAFALLAAAGSMAPAFAGDETNAPPLKKGDALLVRIEGFGGRLPEYREIVDSAGNIEVPFLGFLSADGKSIPALEAEMAAAYAKARLSSNAAVQVTYVTNFVPPPDRANLVRIEDPRRPVLATNMPPPPLDIGY